MGEPTEWLNMDEGVKENFSDSAAYASNWTLATAFLSAPAIILSSDGQNDKTNALWRYGGAVVGDSLLCHTVKFIVRRRRPYTYNTDPFVKKFASSRSTDSSLSFYSGHTSSAFAAATAGSLLVSRSTADLNIKTLTWFLEYGFASATAHLRVKAGRHFYTDIWTGALAGTAIGYIAATAGNGENPSMEVEEILGLMGGLTVGAASIMLMDFSDPGLAASQASGRKKVYFSPYISNGRFGLKLNYNI